VWFLKRYVARECAETECCEPTFSKSLRKHPGTCRAHGGDMEIKNFTDLYVWRRSMDLVVDVYRLTEQFPKSELFSLTAQTHKSVISIPSNVAEGYRRQQRSPLTYLNHLDIALGSEGELFTQLEIGRRLGYVSATTLRKPLADLQEVGRMLNGLSASVAWKISQRSRAVR
jgi:four helix bundle protein